VLDIDELGADELGAGVAAGALDGALISGDLAGGAGSVAAGGDDGAGEGGMPSAAAAPIIRLVMAVVSMSFFSIMVSLEIRMEHRNPPVGWNNAYASRHVPTVSERRRQCGIDGEHGARTARRRRGSGFHSRLAKSFGLQTIP
jgi:hypothetical protein